MSRIIRAIISNLAEHMYIVTPHTAEAMITEEKVPGRINISKTMNHTE
jgi:hypothetical protein